MRVITGIARGRNLEALPGDDVRPTYDRVKEAMFSIIQFEIEGRRVLDLFAGSGQLGIEALSRGAQSATFIDNSKKSIEIVRKNLAAVKMSDKATVIQADAASFMANCAGRFDIAFLDTPYDSKLIEKVLPDVARRMAEGGVIICETDLSGELPETAEDFNIYRTYKYGKTKITVYRRENI
ncbi:MAG: 16S rRNA (guanine(966)-N(2))-methyltransferase RsmD [Clostridia bacterium]|nr:16S rRNA (guanine(966)-N(2))-methyltransferase RsmD [Clostridia bacterium]